MRIFPTSSRKDQSADDARRTIVSGSHAYRNAPSATSRRILTGPEIVSVLPPVALSPVGPKTEVGNALNPMGRGLTLCIAWDEAT